MNTSIAYLLLFQFISAGSFYDLSIVKADGTQLQMSSLAGKKVIIVAYNPGNSDSSQLLILDSLQRTYSAEVTIVVPAIDLSDSASIAAASQQTSSGFSFIMAKPMLVTKNAGQNQDPLFQWLTNVAGNKHFDRDVEQDGQAFFINEKGILYGILGKQSNSIDMMIALQQQINTVQ